MAQDSTFPDRARVLLLVQAYAISRWLCGICKHMQRPTEPFPELITRKEGGPIEFPRLLPRITATRHSRGTCQPILVPRSVERATAQGIGALDWRELAC